MLRNRPIFACARLMAPALLLAATAAAASPAEGPADAPPCRELELPPPVFAFETPPVRQFRALVEALNERGVALDWNAIAARVERCARQAAGIEPRPEGYAWLEVWSDGLPDPDRVPVVGKPWKAVAQDVRRRAATRADADRDASERLLWHLWVESTIESLGNRFNGYTYADTLIARRGQRQGRVFTVGFEVDFDGSDVRIGEVRDPVLTGAGMAAGMRLLALDGIPPDELSYPELIRYWWAGEPFAFAARVAADAGQTLELQGRAMPRRFETVTFARRGPVGYLRIHRFAAETRLELRRALRALDDVQALAIDLRGNGGGVADGATIDMFFKAGVPLVASRDLDAPEAEPRIWLASVEYHPQRLAVLIDRDSASMSEVFAAAIRAHRRGELIGETSFGKGVAQTVIPIGDEGELFLVETLQLYPGTSDTWHEHGIVPDVQVEIDDATRQAVAELLDAPVHDLDRRTEVDPVLREALSRLATDPPPASPPTSPGPASASPESPPDPQEPDR